MYITRQADYGVRCVLFLSREAGRIVSATEISKAMSIPKSFLAKILQRLSKKGIVRSTQGMAGGFELAKQPGEISLLEVVEALQTPSALNACVIDNQQCSLSSSCVVHPIWIELRQHIEKRLKQVTFAELIGKRQE